MNTQAKKINWWNISVNLSFPVFIFLFNLILVGPLFTGEFSTFSFSDQPVFIKIIEFVKASWPQVLWADFWQAGFSPVQIFSPFIPFFSQIFTFFGAHAGQLLRLISGLAYALIPLSLYFFVKFLTGRKIAAFISAFSFSLLPSLNVLFFSEIKEVSASFFHAPWHFIINTLGDAPHTLSLVLIPLTGAYFLYTLKEVSFKKILTCSLLITFTILIDFVSLFSLITLLFVLMFSEVLLSDKIAQSRLGIFLICLIISFGLSSFWFNPSFLNNFFTLGLGFEVGGNLLKIIPYLILTIPWFLIGIFYVFGYRKYLQSFFIAWGWFSFTFIFTFSFFLFGKSFVPQAQRYLIEMNMAFSIILGVVATHFFDWLGRFEGKRHPLANFFRYIFILGILLLIFNFSLPFIKNSWQYNRHLEEANQERVLKLSQWFNENAQARESRVFVPSPEKNWISLKTKNPQLSSPLSQNQSQNSLINEINDYLLVGNDAEISSFLAQITGTKYMVVSEEFNYPERYDAVGEKLASVSGLYIYELDINEGLFRIVDLEKLETLNKIGPDLSKDDILAYAEWQEEFTEAKVEFKTVNNQKRVIEVSLGEGQGILIKENYDSGFKAKALEDLEIKKDPLDFMVIVPKNTGNKEIELSYGLSINQWVGIDITLLTVFFLIFYSIRHKLRALKKRVKTR